MCGPAVTSGSLQRRAWVTASFQAGSGDHRGCTVFMDGSRTLLDNEVPPRLVFGDSVHCEILRLARFLTV